MTTPPQLVLLFFVIFAVIIIRFICAIITRIDEKLRAVLGLKLALN